ncbi:MAG: protein kinase [Kofleriaceae bacterium]
MKPDDVVEGRYRIIKTLGEGGMGTVFLAEHALIKRRVAIKVLHPELATDANVIERFMNEARAAGTLGHPNIVESTDMGFTHDHVPYIVFEYLEGTLLTDEIYRVGGFPVRRAIRIAQQIASALHAAHNAEIVHRDLKSDNVFLTDKDDALDHVKVLDFGISRFLDADDEQTRRGMVMGTPEFMAPEQITAPDQVDRRADIYALGVILYEMLTARRPFSNEDDPRALLHRIVHNAPPPLQRPEVPHGLAELIMTRLLAKDPAARYQNMVDVEAALDGFTTRGDLRPRSRPIAVVATTTVPGIEAVSLPTAPARMRPYVLYGIAGAGLLIGALGLVLGMRGGDDKIVAAPPPAPAVAPAPAPVAIAAPRPAKIEIELAANVSGARITFRRRLSPAPVTLQIAPNDVIELVEVSAPRHKTVRYWLTFDRPTHLVANLTLGDGLVEASEEQTLVALGELAAPTVVAAQVPEPKRPMTVAKVRTQPTRKIGKAAPAVKPVEPLATVVVEPTTTEPVAAKQDEPPVEPKPPGDKPVDEPAKPPEPVEPKTTETVPPVPPPTPPPKAPESKPTEPKPAEPDAIELRPTR